MSCKTIVGFNPSKEDKFFFDTNIWLYLFCPIGNYNKNILEKYSSFYLKVVKAKSKIYVNSMIVSEFFNSYTRIEFRKKQKENPDRYKNYKIDYRNTDEYTELSNGIIEIIKLKILGKSIKINDNFDKIDINRVLENDTNFDFNDNYFLELAKNNDLIIVTHDSDFKEHNDSDIKILTANRKILT